MSKQSLASLAWKVGASSPKQVWTLSLQEVVQALKPGNSAYLIYVPRESLIDTRRYLEILGQLQGELYHTTFRSEIEEVLLKRNR